MKWERQNEIQVISLVVARLKDRFDDEQQVPPSGKHRLRNLTFGQHFMAGALFVVARLSFVSALHVVGIVGTALYPNTVSLQLACTA